MLATWPEIVPTDSVVPTGAMMVLLAAPLPVSVVAMLSTASTR